MATKRGDGGIRRHAFLFVSWLFTNITVTVGLLLFFVFNTTTCEGRENVPRRRNVLVLSNHQSMIDSFLVGICAFYPWSWIRPYLVPWNPAAEENFFKKHSVLHVCSKLWRCIPIREGRRDFRSLFSMLRNLDRGSMILFPEGTRSRSGRVGEGRPGAGLIALGTRATVIPAAIVGMSEVLSVGAWVPRFGRTIRIRFGEPIDYDDLKEEPRTKETAQDLVDRTMAEIRRMKREIDGEIDAETDRKVAADG